MLHNIDQIITTYDIRDDTLLSEQWKPITHSIWERIESYGAGINEYGAEILAPHLTRIAQDSYDFLLYLGYQKSVAHNFYDAIKISDLGKTHEGFDVRLWRLPQNPTQAQRAEKRLHTTKGLEVLEIFLSNASQDLLSHPHIQTVLPAHITGHHTPLQDNPEMGTLMEIACLVDAYDGDMDKTKITHGSGQERTVQEQQNRMLGTDQTEKYKGYFRKELVNSYFEFRTQHRAP